MELARYAKHVERFVLNNSPAILTAIGVAGTLTTAYLTGRASFKAAEVIRDVEDEREPLEARAKFELTWKLYIPAAGTAVLTIAAIICANRISTRRAAVLAAAYSVTEKAFAEYKTKVVDHLGEKKEQKVRDEIAQDHIDRNPVVNREVIITGDGDVLCMDDFTGRYFNSSVEKLRSAMNDINHQVIHDHYASVTDFYDKIGLPQTKASEEFGWNLDKMLDLDISAGLTKDGKPCLVVSFEVSPARNYFRNV